MTGQRQKTKIIIHLDVESGVRPAEMLTEDDTITFATPQDNVYMEIVRGEGVCPAAEFSDLDLNAWYHEAVDFVLWNELMDGVDDSRFDPNVITSRAMLANGWLVYCGQTAGNATEDGNFVYEYTNVAKLFCEIIGM